VWHSRGPRQTRFLVCWGGQPPSAVGFGLGLACSEPLCLRGRRCFSRSRRCRAICIPRVLFIAIYRRGSALNARDRLSRGSQGGYFFAFPITPTCPACPGRAVGRSRGSRSDVGDVGDSIGVPSPVNPESKGLTRSHPGVDPAGAPKNTKRQHPSFRAWRHQQYEIVKERAGCHSMLQLLSNHS